MKYTMRERCLIDTSVLLKVILEGEVGILNKLQDYILCIPLTLSTTKVGRFLLLRVSPTLESHRLLP